MRNDVVDHGMCGIVWCKDACCIELITQNTIMGTKHILVDILHLVGDKQEEISHASACCSDVLQTQSGGQKHAIIVRARKQDGRHFQRCRS